MSDSPIAIARRLYAALEAGKHGQELAPFFAEDASTLEHPNLIKPRGSQVGLTQMLAASTAGAGLLARQTYAVRTAVEVGSLAILRVKWTGVVARAVGPFREGQELNAHLAQFIDTRGGRIASIETFDCYEPFA